MRERRLRWSDLPLAAAAACLFAGGILLIAQVLLGAVAHGKQMKLSADLYGVHRPPAVALNMSNVLSGTYQHAVAQRIAYSEPYFPLAVRLRNQLEYSLFGVQASPSFIIGAHHQLIQSLYIDDYCTRNIHTFMQSAPAWANKIRWMQDQVEARHQIFLYVITTSKVAMYPQDLLPGMPCPSSPADRTGLVPAWVSLVRASGIHVVDTTAALRAAQPQYPFPFYPQGGIHWNAVGSALATQAVEAGLEARQDKGLFKPFTFTWRMSSHPTGTDVDVASVMNMMVPLNHYEVPLVTLAQPPKPADCRRLRIVIVGGSFMQRIGPMLATLPCGAEVTEYFYWNYLDRWSGHGEIKHPADIATRDDDLLHADVVIYEENEALLGHSVHGPALYRWLQQHAIATK